MNERKNSNKKCLNSSCIELLNLLFLLSEDRQEFYDKARKCLEKNKHQKSENCLEELKIFLRKWNKARRLNESEAEEIIKIAMEFIKNNINLDGISEEHIPRLTRKNRNGKKTKQYELIGFLKALHILAPDRFPLVDNLIAERLNLFKNNSRNLKKKIEGIKIFKFCLDNLIKKYCINIFNKANKNIYPYKFLDEFLYLCISQEKEELLKSLEDFLNKEGRECINTLFKIKAELTSCINTQKTQKKSNLR